MNLRRLVLRRIVLLVGLLALLAPSLAYAGGSVSVTRKDLQEAAGGWKVMMTIKLPKKPATPHMAMRFIFTPLVIYETYLDDSGPGEKTRSLNQGRDVQPNIESMDVGFSSPRGDLFDTTKFDFTIRRERNFFAGEYKLEVRDEDNNSIGQPMTLKLQGKNDVVDRRAMVMGGGSGKKKEAPKDDGKGATDGAAGTGATADTTAAPPSDEGAQPPPEVEKKSGGCGCDIPGQRFAGSPWLLTALALGIFVTRRRT